MKLAYLFLFNNKCLTYTYCVNISDYPSRLKLQYMLKIDQTGSKKPLTSIQITRNVWGTRVNYGLLDYNEACIID